MFFQYNRRCRPRNQTPYAWVCSDRQITEEYENDPKCTFIFTASGFRDLFHLLTEVSQKAWASKVPKKLPFLLIAGKSDPVGNYGKGVWKVRNELYFANLKDLECILYPNMRHEILNEVGKLKVYNDILDWICLLYTSVHGPPISNELLLVTGFPKATFSSGFSAEIYSSKPAFKVISWFIVI